MDDSWIHLQFARTIFEGHPWEYSPGYPSTGSTSPLWSILLSGLFFITTDPNRLVWGTYFLSTILYGLSTSLVAKLSLDYIKRKEWAYVIALGFVLLPRNTWLMLSGMETPIFVFLLLLSVVFLDKSSVRSDLLLGVIGGLAFLARPEGVIVITILVPLRFLFHLGRQEIDRRRVTSFIISGVLALAVVLPWVFYCLSTTGHPLPDTFYAKVHPPTSEEIAAWAFWWNFFLQNHLYLIIGFTVGSYILLRGKPYPWLIALGLSILYRLSAPYSALINNFRYLVPVFSFFYLAAILSLAWILENLLTRMDKSGLEVTTGVDKEDFLRVAFVGAIALLFIVPTLPEYTFQADFFGNAVKNINEQQVHIGLWLRANTPENTVLAIHDAGALRFFSNRTIIDLAGLISPEITHGGLDVQERIQYLHDQGCDYFVFFNELFPYYGRYLVGAVDVLYTVYLPDNVISGRDTMSVYFVNWSLTSFR